MKMGSITTRKSKGERNNKNVVQGITQTYSRLRIKLRILLGCMLPNSKREQSSADKSNEGHDIYILPCFIIFLRVQISFLF